MSRYKEEVTRALSSRKNRIRYHAFNIILSLIAIKLGLYLTLYSAYLTFGEDKRYYIIGVGFIVIAVYLVYLFGKEIHRSAKGIKKEMKKKI
ncbi:hypothetical protein KY330_05215 [Candidatus Woesearchaeota archaeon]|nr:hypothetical protein [Candidatus Woesearchaeota archaeon]